MKHTTAVGVSYPTVVPFSTLTDGHVGRARHRTTERSALGENFEYSGDRRDAFRYRTPTRWIRQTHQDCTSELIGER